MQNISGEIPTGQPKDTTGAIGRDNPCIKQNEHGAQGDGRRNFKEDIKSRSAGGRKLPAEIPDLGSWGSNE